MHTVSGDALAAEERPSPSRRQNARHKGNASYILKTYPVISSSWRGGFLIAQRDILKSA